MVSDTYREKQFKKIFLLPKTDSLVPGTRIHHYMKNLYYKILSSTDAESEQGTPLENNEKAFPQFK